MILALYGYGGLGHEIYELANTINASEHKWGRIIALDDYAEKHYEKGVEIMPFNTMCESYPNNEAQVCICVGEPRIRETLYNKVKAAGYQLPALIHPEVQVPQSSSISQGVLVCDGVYISTEVNIDENVLINVHAVIGHNVTIGMHSVISPNAALAGDVSVGKKGYIAMSVPVKEKIHIGDNAIAGMGSVILRDIPDDMIAMGNPARVIACNDGKIFG